PEERQPEQAGECDLMENAEKDETAGHGKVGDQADQQRGARHYGEADGEGSPADRLAVGKIEADADQDEEAAGEGAGKQPPAAHAGRALVEIAEEFEVPGKMVDSH